MQVVTPYLWYSCVLFSDGNGVKFEYFLAGLDNLRFDFNLIFYSYYKISYECYCPTSICCNHRKNDTISIIDDHDDALNHL